jgi:hypothetical protein
LPHGCLAVGLIGRVLLLSPDQMQVRCSVFISLDLAGHLTSFTPIASGTIHRGDNCPLGTCWREAAPDF